MITLNLSNFEKTKDIIKLRWVSEIIFTINFSRLSYSDLLREIEYISGTELQRKLNLLVSNRILVKHSATNKTNYVLTPMGIELHAVFLEILNFSCEHGQKCFD